jgi:hypothetical protein
LIYFLPGLVLLLVSRWSNFNKLTGVWLVRLLIVWIDGTILCESKDG